jgi:2,3-bisphosphoglycerate-dependent phosphoglycerate mutase
MMILLLIIHPYATMVSSWSINNYSCRQIRMLSTAHHRRWQPYHHIPSTTKTGAVSNIASRRFFQYSTTGTGTTPTTTTKIPVTRLSEQRNDGYNFNRLHSQAQQQAQQQQQQQQQPPPSPPMHLPQSTSVLPPVPNNAHRIVLMRHGESEFNNANVFTGWCDVALTPRGIVEAVEAGQVFASHNISFRKCYTSLLTRSIVTAQRTLEAAGASYTPLQYDWRFNERHYGALQGLGKERTADRLGRNIVMEWRRSYHARPPLMTEDHPHYDIIYNDPRYRNVAKYVQLPLGESLEDCQFRVVQAWNDVLLDLASTYQNDDPSSYSFIVAHANSLRALVMHLDTIPVKDIENLNIPTAIPFFYDISTFTGKVISKENVPDSGTFRGTYISDESKKRNFLERRRAANDPFVWALHDHEVTEQMLFGTSNTIANEMEHFIHQQPPREPEGLNGLEEEAKRNTELFSSALKSRSTNPSNQY